AGYDLPHARAFYRKLAADVRSLPGVDAAAVAHVVPLSLEWTEAGIWIPGAANVDATRPLDMPANAVSEGYFATLGIPIVRGREARQVAGSTEALVNESFARRYWPGRDPIGQRVGVEGPGGPWLTVVGVAKDSRYQTVGEAPRPFLYLASDQT